MSSSGNSAWSELFAGGHDSIANGGEPAITKVLELDCGIAHVSSHRQPLAQRPRARLKLGKVHDNGGSGMGQLPLPLVAFQGREPRLIPHRAVSGLEGYIAWKDAQGGVGE